jgi:hypothetical protein
MIASSHRTVGDGGVYKRRVSDSVIVEVDRGLVSRHARGLRRVYRVRQLVQDLSADRKTEFFAQPLAQSISRRSKV